MTPDRIRTLLEQVRDGSLSTEKAMETLRAFPFEDLGFAQLDHHRALRKGFPEVIFCESKTVEQVVAIADRIVSHGADLLATRVTAAQGEALCAAIPQARYNPTARTVALRQSNQPPATRGEILVVCAGTSDLPVAEEALETAKAMGHPVSLLADVGGMEGALASVVGGMVGVPVIAVPTSVGYGAHFGGLAALLGMLNSCATGVTVVNIDNGFGAAAAACIINRA